MAANRAFTDLTGKQYGRLTVLKPIRNSQNRTAWRVRCVCGQEKIVTTGVLNNGNTRSCRCFQKEVATKVCRELGKSLIGTPVKHGHYINKVRSPEYQSWSAMHDRCENSNHQAYKHYGGRGIIICARWRESFENFLTDMGSRPEGKTLDRKDVNGNYEPLNCRWATPREQALNRRPFRAIANFPTADLLNELHRRD
jgi:hypothetical protein